jgi:hypothetical protein
MKRPSSRALSAGALFGLLSVTPAFAQVAGNLGDLHTQTLYMQQYHGLNGYTARAPEPAKTTTSCDVVRARRISVTSPSARFSPSIDLSTSEALPRGAPQHSHIDPRALARGGPDRVAFGGRVVWLTRQFLAENQKSG